MWRCAACLAALLVTVSGNPSSIVAAQEPPTFRSRVQAVEVDVRVTDRDGRPVRGLAREDFVILEKGAPQSIDTFSFVDLEATSPIAVHQPDGQTGMVLADVEVPDFENDAVSLRGLVLASQRSAGQQSVVGDSEFQKRLPITPTAIRRFDKGDVLSAYAEVYTNSTTRMEIVQVRATVARAGDKVPREIPVRRVASETRRVGYIADLPRDLGEGQNVLTLEARAGKRSVTRQSLFTVTGP